MSNNRMYPTPELRWREVKNSNDANLFTANGTMVTRVLQQKWQHMETGICAWKDVEVQND